MYKNFKCLLGISAVAAMCLAASPVRASATDDQIISTFENSYVFRTFLSDEEVSSEAKDGVVTLTGTVANDAQKNLAQETIGGLPGVVQVNNKLVTLAEATAGKADYWISKKVRFTLLFHRHVNAGKTAVSVKNGVVTLRGIASSAAQKDLTSEYAKDIDGVTEVKNEMTLAAAPIVEERTAGEKIDDASVVAQVKTVLLAHRSTSALNTKVIAREGEVTLTGIARNETEKTLVSKIVNDIPGVATVKNEMTIEEPKKQ